MTTTDAPPEQPKDAVKTAADLIEEALTMRFPDAALSPLSRDHPTRIVDADSWLESAQALRDELSFTRFIDLTVVDDPTLDERFEVHLVAYSMEKKGWARLKTRTAEALASVVSVYPAANAYEREAYDMFGVKFEGHPSLTRLLMPEGWPNHPLRRDEPLVTEPVDFVVTRDLYKT